MLSGLLLFPFLFPSSKPLAFDKSLCGNYELFSTVQASDYLYIYHNGRFINEYGAGWMELYEGSVLKFIYDDGIVEDASYSKQESFLLLMTDQTCMQYIDANNFRQENYNSIAPGRYVDQDSTLMFLFEASGTGEVRSLHSTTVLPFGYVTSDSVLRLEYGSGRYEYLRFETLDALLMLSAGGNAPMVLYPAENIRLQGEYILLYDDDPCDDFAIHRICFDSGTATLDGISCQAYLFANNMIVFENSPILYLFDLWSNGPRLTLSSSGNTLEFVNDRAFHDTQRQLAGIYASNDLSVLLLLNEDGTGNYTCHGMGINFTYTLFENILRCCDIATANVVYIECEQTGNGIIIAELPRVNGDCSSQYELIKIS